MGKSIDLTKALYNKHIQNYRTMEQNFLSNLSGKAKTHIEGLLQLTDEDEQNKQINEAITTLENLISVEYVQNSSKNAQQLQQEIAKEILKLDKELRVFGKDESIKGLVALSKGEFDQVVASGQGANYFVSDSELNKWISRIMKRIEQIKQGDSKKFTGYLSNLKGAYLEQAVLNALSEVIPEDIEVTDSPVVINTGAMGSGTTRQISEDIMILGHNGSKTTLKQLLNENKNKRLNIPVPIYEDIQAQSSNAGISVKSGKAPIKFFDGNLNKFFIVNGDDVDIQAYHQNVLNRPKTGHTDNDEGRSVNKYLVAYHLPDAIGRKNLFLSSRSNLLTTMSKKLEDLRDNGQLYMSSYKISGKSISGRIMEPKY